MKIYELVMQAATNKEFRLTETMISGFDMPFQAFADTFAKCIVNSYQNRQISWSEGDWAINALFSYNLDKQEGGMLEGYAGEVFFAFDAGEYIHSENPAHVDNSVITNELLAKIKKQPVI